MLSDSTLVTDLSTGLIAPMPDKMMLKLYPVPAKTHLNIAFTQNEAKSVQLKVMSVDGKVVMSNNQSTVSGANLFTIDTSHLQKGLYFLSIFKDGKIVKTQKFTKN